MSNDKRPNSDVYGDDLIDTARKVLDFAEENRDMIPIDFGSGKHGSELVTSFDKYEDKVEIIVEAQGHLGGDVEFYNDWETNTMVISHDGKDSWEVEFSLPDDCVADEMEAQENNGVIEATVPRYFDDEEGGEE